ncbi:MAG TPA: uroporphyrinogen decarboxylase family protein [Opitutaceae bacterium]|nr:uroporphyrinogen decarboxylase family protein [Opitutaceae bacterium]
MSRDLLDLASQRHRVPIAADLVLHKHADADQIIRDGGRLGEVVAEAAEAFHTPLAFPLMDLRLEKAELLNHFGVATDDIEKFHFVVPPTLEQRRNYATFVKQVAPSERVAANLGAVHSIRSRTKLVPVGMCIGPYSLTSKLMADPITPIYLAGMGVTAEEEPEVALLEACMDISITCVMHEVELAVAAGAKAIFIAEPAANQIFFSPLQLAAGSDIFERCVLAPNRRIAALLADRGVDLIFHCCGEITDGMLEGFCSLRPAMLSLGSSRKLWDVAPLVPKDIVLYGNLPSKMFYSDQMMPLTRVAEDTARLAAQMEATGHPFILGTECDTLHVPEYAATICKKVDCMLTAA